MGLFETPTVWFPRPSAVSLLSAVPLHGFARLNRREWLNFLMVGAKCEWVLTTTERFKGDIGEMRFTGRNM